MNYRISSTINTAALKLKKPADDKMKMKKYVITEKRDSIKTGINVGRCYELKQEIKYRPPPRVTSRAAIHKSRKYAYSTFYGIYRAGFYLTNLLVDSCRDSQTDNECKN